MGVDAPCPHFDEVWGQGSRRTGLALGPALPCELHEPCETFFSYGLRSRPATSSSSASSFAGSIRAALSKFPVVHSAEYKQAHCRARFLECSATEQC